MKVLELFAGTRSIGRAFEKRGHDVFSVEWDKQFKDINLYEDILNVTPEQIIEEWGGVSAGCYMGITGLFNVFHSSDKPPPEERRTWQSKTGIRLC